MTVIALLVSAAIGVAGFILQRVVEINWQQAMTGQYLDRWMRGHLPYRIERDRTVVSVAHRATVERFHERQLALEPVRA